MVDEKKCRILIVNDEKDLCEFIKTQFDLYNFETFLAYDGAEGFQKTLSVKPDCILLDIRMPGEDGLTFLRKLRAYRDETNPDHMIIRRAPVIIMTGAGQSLKPLFELEGISGYFQKPFDFNLLRQKIIEITGGV